MVVAAVAEVAVAEVAVVVVVDKMVGNTYPEDIGEVNLPPGKLQKT